jgi:glycosyltransferase involved in cell wall biosynthesis
MRKIRKVALVHDWLVGMRGGEKVLEVFCALYPGATLFTLVHRPGSVSPIIDSMDIRTSFIEMLPRGLTRYQYYLPLFPKAIESFDLRDYDLVISSSHAAAKGVRVRHDALHICYCHTPMRYIWDQYDQYFGKGRSSVVTRTAMKMFREYLQRWDVRSAKKVDYFIANSHYVADRIKRIYERSSTVIYPPVDVDRFASQAGQGKFDLIVSGLVPYKRIDIAIEAYNRMKKPLVIAGNGSEEARLRRMAGPTIEFRGYVTDEEVSDLYAGCRALIFPGEEDFGIVPVEAMASGKPVIAFGKGGATETVVDGVTGCLFGTQDAACLAECVEQSESIHFLAEPIRRHAQKFSTGRFTREIEAFIAEQTAK